jgi:hypothetical protein
MENAYSNIEGQNRQTGPTETVAPDNVAIRIEGLTKRFKDVTAVDRVSFNVRAGEIFGNDSPRCVISSCFRVISCGAANRCRKSRRRCCSQPRR